jgi:hypothetical protein
MELLALLGFLSEQARNSLPGPQLSVEEHAQFREGVSEFPCLQKVFRISRSARKLQLRLRKRFKQQHASRTKRVRDLWIQGMLQILNAQDQTKRVLRKLDAFKIRLEQVNASMCAALTRVEGANAVNGNPPRMAACLQSTALTCCPRAASSSACRPAPQARSSAGPRGSKGSNSRTMLAGSAGASAATLYFASQSVWLEGIKKAPERVVQEPKELFWKRVRRFHSRA